MESVVAICHFQDQIMVVRIKNIAKIEIPIIIMLILFQINIQINNNNNFNNRTIKEISNFRIDLNNNFRKIILIQ